jgi:ABC-type multidrug transport system ATPase subunit
MSVIEIEQLCKSYRVYQKQEGLLAAVRGLFRREYRDVQAVRDVSLQVEQGEFVAFLGPNGAGKTTTLKLLSGVIYPTSGTARVLGYVPWQREVAYRRRFALVMGQKNQLWWDLPAADSFQLLREIYAIPPAEFRATLAELTGLLGVEKLTRQAVRELALGERMKMELIAALLHRPKVLFLDEPTIGLDVVSQKKVREFLRQYNAEHRIVTFVTFKVDNTLKGNPPPRTPRCRLPIAVQANESPRTSEEAKPTGRNPWAFSLRDTRCRGTDGENVQAPNTQIPKKPKAPMTKTPCRLIFPCLTPMVLGIWEFFGIWAFGACDSLLNATATCAASLAFATTNA